MTPTLQKALASLRHIELGYSNDQDDPGGETNHGITIKVARAYGYRGAMKDLPYETAVSIYTERYWHSNKLDEIAAISDRIALELFDSGVNVGVTVAARWLQEWLNALNRDELDYQDIEADSRIGRLTLAALRGYVNKRGNAGVDVMLNGLNASQACYYKSIKMEKYLYGWMANRVTIV